MGLAKTFLAIGIAVIFTVFIAYGLYVIYEPPKFWEQQQLGCESEMRCEDMTMKCDPMKEKEAEPINSQACYEEVQQTAEYRTCVQKRSECEDAKLIGSPIYTHAKINFYLLLAIGIASMIAGTLIKTEGVGSGFIGSGVLLILWSLIYTWEYWFKLSKYVKLVMLGVVLAVLLYLGFKKVETWRTDKKTEDKKPKKRK